jgi:RNA polymerase sigma factor (sigma-70 family)
MNEGLSSTDSNNSDIPASGGGPLEARYLAFLETITNLRPSLHSYCSRMTGSVLDGEDVVQEALFQAYRKLDTFDETRPLAPWLFRIAHNRCVDFLRRRGIREQVESERPVPTHTRRRQWSRSSRRSARRSNTSCSCCPPKSARVCS